MQDLDNNQKLEIRSLTALRDAPADQRTAILILEPEDTDRASELWRAWSDCFPNASISVVSQEGNVKLAGSRVEPADRSFTTPHTVAIAPLLQFFEAEDADAFVVCLGIKNSEVPDAARLARRLIADRSETVFSPAKRAVSLADKSGSALLGRLIKSFAWAALRSRANPAPRGFHVVSRDFAKSFPQCPLGTDVETELALHALEMMLPEKARKTSLWSGRLAISPSKSGGRVAERAFSVGVRLVAHRRILQPFILHAICLALTGLLLAIAIAWLYFDSGNVPYVLAGLMLVSLACSALLFCWSAIIVRATELLDE